MLYVYGIERALSAGRMRSKASNQLLAILAEPGMTRAIVGRKIGVTYHTICNWASGYCKPEMYAPRRAMLKHYGIEMDAWDESAEAVRRVA